MFCKYCGSKLEELDRFCPECGKPVSSANNVNVPPNINIQQSTSQMAMPNQVAGQPRQAKGFPQQAMGQTQNYQTPVIQQNPKVKRKTIFIWIGIVIVLLSGAFFGYRKLSVHDPYRGYTAKTTVSDVQKAERYKLDSSFEADKVDYYPLQDAVWNEDKGTFEYHILGDTDQIGSLYYEKAKVQGISAEYGMEITFDNEMQCINAIKYYLDQDGLDKFEEKVGEPDKEDSDTGWMRWTYPYNVSVHYYDNLQETNSWLKHPVAGYTLVVVFK